jgi:uncharacterized membrane protein
VKRILLVVLAVALLLGGLAGGVAYATNGETHRIVQGQKLIGVGWYGATDPDMSTPVEEGVSIFW